MPFPLQCFNDSTSSASEEDRLVLINNYFNSIFTKCSFTLPDLEELPKNESFHSSVEITEDDVFMAIVH